MTWEDVIDHYGLDVTWQGSQWRGPCPVHRGDNISAFVITPTKGFHCFACGVGGGLAAFLRLMGDEDGAAAIDVRSARERPEPAPEAPAVPLQPLDPTHRYFRERGIHETTARHSAWASSAAVRRSGAASSSRFTIQRGCSWSSGSRGRREPSAAVLLPARRAAK